MVVHFQRFDGAGNLDQEVGGDHAAIADIVPDRLAGHGVDVDPGAGGVEITETLGQEAGR